jgi:hypothetical protein
MTRQEYEQQIFDEVLAGLRAMLLEDESAAESDDNVKPHFEPLDTQQERN